jgi:hypothetical protein
VEQLLKEITFKKFYGKHVIRKTVEPVTFSSKKISAFPRSTVVAKMKVHLHEKHTKWLFSGPLSNISGRKKP